MPMQTMGVAKGEMHTLIKVCHAATTFMNDACTNHMMEFKALDHISDTISYFKARPALCIFTAAL